MASLTLRLTKTITCNITTARIARAKPGCSSCPIAITLVDRGFDAAVGDRGATVSLASGVFAEYRLPKIGRELARRFDTGWALVSPASFRITRMS